MNKDFLLFDLDGTIIDPKEGITKAIEYSLQSFGLRVNDREELTPFIGPPLGDSFCKFYGFDEPTAQAAVAKYREYYSRDGIFDCTLYPGLEALLQEQRQLGKKLILATSKPTVFAEQILQYFNIAGYFSFIAGSELSGQRVKKGQVIQYALENMQVTAPMQALMIGDREHDIIGARENGLASIGVLYGYGSLPELCEAGASYIVASVTELAQLLKE